jgi:hypothetical protein
VPAITDKTKTLHYRNFSEGINQTASRPALKDTELWYAENVQPIGSGQLKVLPPPAPPIATIAAGIATMWGETIKISGVETSRLITVNNDGSMNSVDPTNGNVTNIASIATPNPVSTKARMAMWQDNPLLIGDPTHGLYSWDGTTLTSIPSPAPANIFDVAVFQGRACLISGTRAITLSAPAVYSDYATVDGAFTYTITDSVFTGSIKRLLSALEVLWTIGPSAVNAISNVQITAGNVTSISNTNIVANVGTNLPSSVTSFFRTFLFLTPYGVYAIVGATPQKLSDSLDGLFPNLTFGSDQPAGVVSLSRIFVWTVLVNYTDPLTNVMRPVLLCLSRNAWFIASQGNLTWITSLVNLTTGEPELWGTDGTNIYKCFAGTVPGYFRFDTKFFDFGAFTQRKQMLRLAVETQSPKGNINMTATVTNEESVSTTVSLQAGSLVLVFVGTAAIQFTGSGGNPIYWDITSFSFVGPVNMAGDYLGITISGTSLPFTVSGLGMEIGQLGEWT